MPFSQLPLSHFNVRIPTYYNSQTRKHNLHIVTSHVPRPERCVGANTITSSREAWKQNSTVATTWFTSSTYSVYQVSKRSARVCLTSDFKWVKLIPDSGPGPLNKYLQDHGYRNALFINISIKSDTADTGNTQSNISRLEASFLDTSDLANVPCDGAGEAWIDKILTTSNTYTTGYCRPILATAQHLEASRIPQVFAQVENKAMVPGLNGLLDVIRNLTHTKCVLICHDLTGRVTMDVIIFIQEESTK